MTESISERVAAIIAHDIKKEGLFGNIDVHKTRELIRDVGALFIDVRPPKRVEGENAQEAGIKNAIYAPYPDFADYIDELPKDKTTPIVTGCLKGWFANRVMGYLELMGYVNVYVLDCPVDMLIEVHHSHTEK